MTKHIFLTILVLWVVLAAGSASASPPSVTCTAKVLDKGDSQQVFLDVYVPRLASATAPEDVSIDYEVWISKKNNQVIREGKVPFTAATARKNGTSFVVSFTILAPKLTEAVMIVKITDLQSARSIFEEVPLGVSDVPALAVTGLRTEEPLSYVRQGDTVLFRGAQNETVYVYRIREDFSPAAPPMSMLPPKVEANLKVDSLFAVPANTPLVLSVKALYLAQTDTTQAEGLGFRVTDKNFPRYKNADLLIAPLIYVSTPEELTLLESAPDKKAALDTYWLRLTNDADKAREMIKLFYQRVEYANRMFTNYREGWKTDMGMIYIVFGEPDEIRKSGEGQNWIYRLPYERTELKFTFLKKSNQFSSADYRLVRTPRVKDVWYSTIAQWRGENNRDK